MCMISNVRRSPGLGHVIHLHSGTRQHSGRFGMYKVSTESVVAELFAHTFLYQLSARKRCVGDQSRDRNWALQTLFG
jgi:hypothetical protein